MSSFPNPLTGASWGAGSSSPNAQSPTTQPPWLGNAPGIGTGQRFQGGWGNPEGNSNPTSTGGMIGSTMTNNIIAGQMKNQLAPLFAQMMQQYGGQAGDFFKNLMNLGSPYYQQQQQAAFTQGNQQNQNAAAQARQQLGSQGYGSGPSGANAAMIGGMAQQGSQNLAEQYLQNLFQNEQMQAAGAQGLSSLAGLFNPTQLLGGTSAGVQPQQQPNFFQDFNQIMTGLQGAGGSSGPSGTSIAL